MKQHIVVYVNIEYNKVIQLLSIN